MNQRVILLGLVALVTFGLACDIFPAPGSSSDTVCDGNGCISLNKLSANISTTLARPCDG